jgi:hypothetical protein
LVKRNTTDECIRNESSGMEWSKARIWKLRGIKKGYEKAVYPRFGGGGC